MPVTFRTFENIFTAPEVNAAIAGDEYVFNGSRGIEPSYPNNFFESGYIKVANTAASCSVIAGGYRNHVSVPYPAILGGQGNNDSGIPFTGMFGNDLVAAPFVTPAPSPLSAFWVDTKVALNVAIVTAAQCVGLPNRCFIYYCYWWLRN